MSVLLLCVFLFCFFSLCYCFQFNLNQLAYRLFVYVGDPVFVVLFIFGLFGFFGNWTRSKFVGVFIILIVFLLPIIVGSAFIGYISK